MKKISPILVLLLAVGVAVFCIFGDDSYSRLVSLRHTLESERTKNNDLSDSVGALRREVRSLQTDPRAVEKAARNELGMARPSEQVFFFEKSDIRPDNESKE